MDIINKLPNEIKIIIANMISGICNEFSIQKKTYPITKCSFCKNLLCNYHAEQALKYGKKYRFYNCYMCDSCCWWEIT